MNKPTIQETEARRKEMTAQNEINALRATALPRGSGSRSATGSALGERVEAARRRLVQKWNDMATELLNNAGVPEWVEVGGVPGNSMPHRLEWFILRRRNVSATEAAGVCEELNAMEKAQNAALSDKTMPTRTSEAK